MDTPICDFVRRYAESGALRLHMPGHKGVGTMGEPLDITEIDGADSLYEASGIIRQSERNAGALFGAETFYSCGGSSLCIRAMVYLCLLYAKARRRRPLIAAGRNAHRTFLTAAALLDVEVLWLCPENGASYLSCPVDAAYLEGVFRRAGEMPVAVYLTSPDYLGNMVDITSIGEVCHRHGALLVVDNAHGAYLNFLPESRHPVALGADLCCDSAHKTLPVLTGGAYLHISPHAPEIFSGQAKNALSMFGSTSPSYLILQSLDNANRILAGDYRARLSDFVEQVREVKHRLRAHGYTLRGDEPLKLTMETKPWGYRGWDFARCLLERGIVCEFSDPDFVVMMLTPSLGSDALPKLEAALLSIPKKAPIMELPPRFYPAERVMSVREAAMRPHETVTAEESLGRVLGAATVACPPAVPIVVCGERIDRWATECFRYYGVENCAVVAEG